MPCRAEQTETRVVYELLRLPFDCQLANIARTFLVRAVCGNVVESTRHNNFK